MVVARLAAMPDPTRRAPRPDDLYRFRIATDVQLAPAGDLAVFVLQAVAPGFEGYRRSIWSVATDGSRPAVQLTLAAKQDTSPRFSADGRTLAFLSDRRLAVEDEPAAPEDREDLVQVHLLPLDRPGEARRLTDLPRGVSAFEWSPDGRSLAVVSASHGATRAEDARRRGRPAAPPAPGTPPPSDYRYLDRLRNSLNGTGWIYDRTTALWLVDVATGAARLVHRGRSSIESVVWSPDGSRIAFALNDRPDGDLDWLSDAWVVEAAGGRPIRITGGRGIFEPRAWLPDGRELIVMGHRWPALAGSRVDLWRFAADGSENGRDGGRNLSGRHDRMIGADLNSDLTVGEPPRVWAAPDGGTTIFSAPDGEGAYELWRIDTRTGDLERLTEGRHYLSSWSARPGPGGTVRVAALRSSPTELPDVWFAEIPTAAGRGRRGRGPSPTPLRHLTALNDEALAGIRLAEPETRSVTVDGRRIQGWYLPAQRPHGTATGDGAAAGGHAAAGGPAPSPAPLVAEIHGGPQTHYGWSPIWEFQVLAAAGIGVWYSNPRGSDGAGQAFAAANVGDWGPGPMADVMAGVDALVVAGLADPARLGVTGGSYGGYLTSWIVGHTDRFRAAISCRAVNDLQSQMTTGDIAGPIFARVSFGVTPWDDPEKFRLQSPITYAANIRTPLLIQHSERDLRTPIGQGEELFAILRSLRRPVRFMRVPDETHELTRSGTPFRRVENLVQVRAWFEHFLVRGRRGLPPLPRARAGR